jgi:LPXTG-motif cell wall-anchored protein
MKPWLLARLVVAAAAAGTLALASAGASWASPTDATLNPDHVGKLATQFDQSCSPFQGGGPYAGFDVWVFIAPSTSFVSLHITFDDPSSPTDVVVDVPTANPSYPNGIATNGSDKAWIKVPAGWTVVSGTAVIDPANVGNHFNVTHTCAGGTSTSPSPSPSPSGSPSGSPSPSQSPFPSGSPSPSGSGTPSTSGSTTPPPNDGGLPKTGAALGGLIAAAVLLIGGGTALLYLRRRRDGVSTPNNPTV